MKFHPSAFFRTLLLGVVVNGLMSNSGINPPVSIAVIIAIGFGYSQIDPILTETEEEK